MRRWQYKKLSLNDAPRRSNEIDLLCDAGEGGWELVAIPPNNIAYLKREIDAGRNRHGRRCGARGSRCA